MTTGPFIAALVLLAADPKDAPVQQLSDAADQDAGTNAARAEPSADSLPREIHCGGGSYDIGDENFYPLTGEATERCGMDRMKALNARYSWLQAKFCPPNLGGRDEDGRRGIGLRYSSECRSRRYSIGCDGQRTLADAAVESERAVTDCIKDAWLMSALARSAEICAGPEITRRLKLRVNAGLVAADRGKLQAALPALAEQAKRLTQQFQGLGDKPTPCSDPQVRLVLSCALPKLKDGGKSGPCYFYPTTDALKGLALAGLDTAKP